MDAERVRGHGVAQRLLKGVVLQLDHQPIGLLPLRLPLLCRLSPGNGVASGERTVGESVRPLLKTGSVEELRTEARRSEKKMLRVWMNNRDIDLTH